MIITQIEGVSPAAGGSIIYFRVHGETPKTPLQRFTEAVWDESINADSLGIKECKVGFYFGCDGIANHRPCKLVRSRFGELDGGRWIKGLVPDSAVRHEVFWKHDIERGTKVQVVGRAEW